MIDSNDNVTRLSFIIQGKDKTYMCVSQEERVNLSLEYINNNLQISKIYKKYCRMKWGGGSGGEIKLEFVHFTLY